MTVLDCCITEIESNNLRLNDPSPKDDIAFISVSKMFLIYFYYINRKVMAEHKTFIAEHKQSLYICKYNYDGVYCYS